MGSLTDPCHSSVLQITARHAPVVDSGAANDWPALTVTQLDPGDGSVVFGTMVSDPDDDKVTCTATQPFSGTVTDVGDGRFRYQPTAAPSGVLSTTSRSPPTTGMAVWSPRRLR